MGIALDLRALSSSRVRWTSRQHNGIRAFDPNERDRAVPAARNGLNAALWL